jgi:hypothetical protein
VAGNQSQKHDASYVFPRCCDTAVLIDTLIYFDSSHRHYTHFPSGSKMTAHRSVGLDVPTEPHATFLILVMRIGIDSRGSTSGRLGTTVRVGRIGILDGGIDEIAPPRIGRRRRRRVGIVRRRALDRRVRGSGRRFLDRLCCRGVAVRRTETGWWSITPSLVRTVTLRLLHVSSENMFILFYLKTFFCL